MSVFATDLHYRLRATSLISSHYERHISMFPQPDGGGRAPEVHRTRDQRRPRVLVRPQGGRPPQTVVRRPQDRHNEVGVGRERRAHASRGEQ